VVAKVGATEAEIRSVIEATHLAWGSEAQEMASATLETVRTGRYAL
jgi:hypothetical protein